MTLLQLRLGVAMIFLRGNALFGRTGWLGLALCVVSAIWFAHAWQQHRQDAVDRSSTPLAITDTDTSPSPVHPAPDLQRAFARSDEQALLLTQVQQVAISEGLAWAAADYKLMPAGEATPLSLEIRCTLKGGYPKVRAALARWISQVPGLAIRGLTLSRSSSEAAEVEAKLHLVIFLSGDAAVSRP